MNSTNAVGGRCALGSPRTRRAGTGDVALVDEAGAERSCQALLRAAGVVDVVAARLASQQVVIDVVDVVVPLRIVVDRRSALVALEQMRLVAVVLEHQMDVPLGGDRAPDGRRDLLQDVLLAAVDDLVDGIEAQAVEAELLEPVQYVAARSRARSDFVIDRRAPGRVLSGSKKSFAYRDR